MRAPKRVPHRSRGRVASALPDLNDPIPAAARGVPTHARARVRDCLPAPPGVLRVAALGTLSRTCLALAPRDTLNPRRRGWVFVVANQWSLMMIGLNDSIACYRA